MVLNGAPRSGKSSIVRVIQDTFEGAWMNLGVDAFNRCVLPPRYSPGMGLRPGGEVPEPVRRWQRHVHEPGTYDLEIDTSVVTPRAAAAMIRDRLAGPPPSAFRRLAVSHQDVAKRGPTMRNGAS